MGNVWVYFNGFVQDCSNSIANTLELMQSCTKPLIWCFPQANVIIQKILDTAISCDFKIIWSVDQIVEMYDECATNGG